MAIPNSNEEVKRMNELSEARLWKVLDSISDRLGSIEKQLSEVVRLEEKVNNHTETLKRYGNKIDQHDERLRDVENWQSKDEGKSRIGGKVVTIIAAFVSSVLAAIIAYFVKGS